ncbi:MAG TPA: hypothetical protein VGI77_10715 [Gaiellaceae bacterium]
MPRLWTAGARALRVTRAAEEGEFELAGYAAIGRWLERVAAEPGHVPMV